MVKFANLHIWQTCLHGKSGKDAQATSPKQSQACFSLLLICCEVMKVRPIARNHTNCCGVCGVRFTVSTKNLWLFAAIDLSSCRTMRWLQNEDHTWRQWAIVNWIWIRWRWGPIPIGHENTTTMQTKIPKQPTSSNSHSRRRSPLVKWPPAVPIWLQWAIARSTFWRSVNSQVTICD